MTTNSRSFRLTTPPAKSAWDNTKRRGKIKRFVRHEILTGTNLTLSLDILVYREVSRTDLIASSSCSLLAFEISRPLMGSSGMVRACRRNTTTAI